MKREARLLRNKALDSLVLAVEHFNRPFDRGRTSAVLILLDHAFEMLLKAAILHKGGRIRERRARQTIGFDACVRKALTDATVRFLTHEQALALQAINGLRDAAQHHLLEIPEQQLYLHTQIGVTLFRDILAEAFGQNLAEYLPKRVLPISTEPPRDLSSFVGDEVELIRGLLKPGRRRRVEARARVRALAILEAATRGHRAQPTEGELNRILERMAGGERWSAIFPGVAALGLAVNGAGTPVEIRITKREGVPVHLVPEGSPDATVVAVRRVNLLDHYSLGLRQLARHVGLSEPRTRAVVRHLRLQEDENCFREFQVGSQRFKRYSPRALERVREALPTLDVDEIWAEHRPRPRARRV